MKPSDVPEIVRAQSKQVQFNHEALDIFDGNLLPYLDAMLKEQLSPQSYIQARHRLSPINILPKVIDKLTNIYQTTVIRQAGSSEQDQKIMDHYAAETRMDTMMNSNNELFNLCGSMLLQPYAYEKKLRLRTIPNDRFVVYSDDMVEPTKPTHVILCYKKNSKPYYWVYSADQIYITDEQGRVDSGAMAAAGVDGSNPFGAIPFIYGNSSKYKLTPSPDEDGLTIVKLLPLMLSDLNHAAMFQCFSILYLVDAKTSPSLKYAPNVIWEFESNPASTDKPPQIGTIKPEVDYDKVTALIKDQLSMWLGTKGIRASAIDGLTSESFASGISKVIDEMDTFEARQKQVTEYQCFEQDYWKLIAEHMHPYWTATGQIENVGLFSSAFKPTVEFAVQLPVQTRGQVVVDLKTEYEAGFISRKAAIQKLNPQLSQKQIEEMIAEIDAERTVTVPEVPGLTNSNNEDPNNGMAANQFGSAKGPGAGSTPGASGPGN